MTTVPPTPSGSESPAPPAPAATDAPGTAPVGADAAAAPAVVDPCRVCAAPLVDGQEWCLECGAARHQGRLASARRPFIATVGVTIALLGVAVAASYAAIIDQPPVLATATVPAPPVVAVVPPPATTATTPPPTTSTPNASTTPTITPSNTAPYVPPVSSGTPYVPPVSTGGTTTTTTTNTTPTTTTPTVPALTALPLKADAATAYNPNGFQLAPNDGDPGRAMGTSTKTWWTAETAAPTTPVDPASPKADCPAADPAAQPPNVSNPHQMCVGLLLGLGGSYAVQQLRLATTTPGFSVAIYGSSNTPAGVAGYTGGITDSRWAILKDRKKVDGTSNADPKHEVISIGDGNKYRTVMIWVTYPPPKPQDVLPTANLIAKISAVQILK